MEMEFNEPDVLETIQQYPAMGQIDRAEGLISFRIKNMTKLRATIMSPQYYIHKFPWKIIVKPRAESMQHVENRTLGVFIQCNGENRSTTWSCNAIAELRIRSFNSDHFTFIRRIKHTFRSEENDWGFSHFISWTHLFDPRCGYVKDDAVLLEALIVAEIPQEMCCNSRQLVGYVGLKNQGATCYMNSLLQTMFFTNELRKAVYQIPTETGGQQTNTVVFALQRLFYQLQFSNKSVATRNLTASFGWGMDDSFMQHDVQEFLRVLLDNIERKMNGTCVEGTIPRLFEGSTISFIKCKNIDYESSRTETFYDIQLNIRGKKTIYESFNDYIAKENLDGDNQYDAGIFGLQDAEKGVIFELFPPVLHLHLMRFQYDPVNNRSVKYNDRFEFYEHICLDKYLNDRSASTALASMGCASASYTLHAVLAHSGNNHRGHYVVFIDPRANGNWCKFNDDHVTKCSKHEAIDQNFGINTDGCNGKQNGNSNAYMLVYILDSALSTILHEINEYDIPLELSNRLADEQRRVRTRMKKTTTLNVYIFLDEYIYEQHHNNLFDLAKTPHKTLKVQKELPIMNLIEMICDEFQITTDKLRLWSLIPYRNDILRPVFLNYMNHQTMNCFKLARMREDWFLFMENTSFNLNEFNLNNEMIVFLQYYDPGQMQLNYCGYQYVMLDTLVSDFIVQLNSLMNWPTDTEISIYKRHNGSIIHKISNSNEKISTILHFDKNNVHGDTLIFEQTNPIGDYELKTYEEFFNEIQQYVQITFVEKNKRNDLGFTLEMSVRNSYDHIARIVGAKINYDPYKIKFYRCHSRKDIPGFPLRMHGSLRTKLRLLKSKNPCKLFYERLDMTLDEMEMRKLFKCGWLSINLKDKKQLALYPIKTGTVHDLLAEALKHILLNPDDGSGRLRILQIEEHKILTRLNEDQLLESIQSTKKVYRIEEIPCDQIDLESNECLMPITHFDREITNAFGIPFYIKVKQGDTFGMLKECIKTKLQVCRTDWERYKFAIIALGSLEYINDDNQTINVGEIQMLNQLSCCVHFGIDHQMRAPKRGQTVEKSIVIFN